ncbi:MULTISPECIES: Gfo/Idh/MocA family protein [Paenibacillus]|uniref:Gfo/Idh/MocA family protein n=2 Tax=Paenibacillus TaxID=44249 RepID=UPI0007FBCD02|nr:MULTISPECIES: Gfo/Idh/MocA family oxidoreductase [Paenibacillus]OAX49001.1 scyllo-inositol 2-dehydrogenase (NAD(+)) [Paenibacillus sp. AD87]WDQ30606.1 Gfo/Idh/MocA family oxidoreductase [Paenibacillus marchantiae]SDK12674.1 Predicted dehydrogenase [Paenibacillus sp. OK060]SHN56401.1 Predicted dehydrogenase [Paenibacillus sp. ov031]SLJ94853.1 Predicted dehydrogenase [Paenibacillus sp. RU5A]
MTIRIGKISLWHVHAWDYIKQAQEHEDTVMAAVWDEDAERGQEAAERLNVPFYASLEDMLAQDNIDAVIVDAPTRLHEDVITAAAKAGKHIFTEKVIASTIKEVNTIISDVQDNGVKMTVSLPRLNDGYTLTIQDVLNQGLLGKVTYVRVRLSHNGAIGNWLPEHFYHLEDCQGGALIDLGCHPMYLTNLFLGQEVTGVNANFGYVTGKEVEDNAVATLFTDSGAIGVVEAGFVNSHSPFAIEVHGTEGTLLYGTPEDKLLIRTNVGSDQQKEWTEIPLLDRRESAFSQWVSHIQNDTIATENLQTATQLTRLMEAANLSAKEGRKISLKELQG